MGGPWFESPVLLAWGFFFLVVSVTKTVFDNRTKRKLIEARIPEDVVRALFRKERDPELFSALKWGLVLVFAGLGLGVYLLLDTDESTLALVFLLVGGGLGLLAYYRVATAILKADRRAHPDPEYRDRDFDREP